MLTLVFSIILIVVVFIVFAVAKAKISPGSALIYLIFATAVLLAFYFYNTKNDIITKSDNPENNEEFFEPDTLKDPAPPGNDDGTDNGEVKPSQPKSFGPYTVKDSKFWTYSTDGDWTWTDVFIREFEEKTGWRYQKKKGNYLFAVKHFGSITKEEAGVEQSYVYNGGVVEFRVNEKACCCQKKVTIDAGISGRNMSQLNQRIQEAISDLVMKEKEYIIPELVNCL